MTQERRNEIRNVFAKGEVSYGPYAVSLGGEMARAGTELLAEVDRLEAVVDKVRGIAGGLRKTARGDVQRLSDFVCINLAKTTAAALESALASPLDSTPAKR